SGESLLTPKNSPMTSDHTPIKTNTINFPGSASVSITFSHDNPYVSHETYTILQVDQLTQVPRTPNQNPEPNTASTDIAALATLQHDLPHHTFTEGDFFDLDIDTAEINKRRPSIDSESKQKDTEMEIVSDSTIESEYPETILLEKNDLQKSEPITTPRLIYSAVASGKNAPLINRKTNRGSLNGWKEQVEKHLRCQKQAQRLDNFNEETWDVDKIMEILHSKENLMAFTRYKLSTIPTDIRIPTAINTKILHRDTAFFRSFTRIASAQAPHQIEFTTLLNKATDRYKRLHNIPMTNKTNRDQIFFGLRKKIAIDYLKNLDFLVLNGHEITSWLFYLWGFGKIEKHIDFAAARAAINSVINEAIIPLPDRPEDISENICTILPFQLPIDDHYNTRQLV